MIKAGDMVRILSTGEVLKVLEVRVIAGVKHVCAWSGDYFRHEKITDVEEVKCIDK